MNSLYLENSIIGSLFRFFSPYFSAATRPTQFLLTWLVIAQLALQPFPSFRFLHRNFLAQVTHRCLNSYYRVLQNETNGPVSPPANGGIGVQFDSCGFTEWAGLPQCRWYDGTEIWNASPQELRNHISWQIQREIFFGTLVAKAQTAKNPTDLVQALCKLVLSTSEAT